MKDKIHPKYYTDAQVTCACGNTLTTGSTQPEIEVDICSQCHPFFTGEMKLIDTQGRIEKFKAKRAQAAKLSQGRKKKQIATKSKQVRPRSLKEMLQTSPKKAKENTSPLSQ